MVRLRTQTDFGRILKIVWIYNHCDCANKMQIEQLMTMLSDPDTVLCSEERNSKQIEFGRKQREHEKWQSEISLNIDARKETPT